MNVRNFIKRCLRPLTPSELARAQGFPDSYAAAKPAPVTYAEAGRGGYILRHERERAEIRKCTIALAMKIGRPDLAERLR